MKAKIGRTVVMKRDCPPCFYEDEVGAIMDFDPGSKALPWKIYFPEKDDSWYAARWEFRVVG